MGDERPEPDGVAAIGRDPDALEAFYRRHVAEVTGFVARRVADPHTVDDLTTEVFLAAIEAADRYRPGRGAPRAWLLGIARNLVAAEWRRRAGDLDKTRREGSRRTLDDDDISRLEEQIDAERASRALHAVLATLPPKLRGVVELVDLDGLSLAEAAAALGVRDGTARVRLHRARKVLKAASAPSRDGVVVVKGAGS
ncbi:RNA polymerase sigma factor [Actinocorallia sp. A-T 12471]|uniref:RNA polymerase sigma factor n=1 Tax=Actinocorallia sp. A-T 12471 TaxID=3089813 RepID=UPI0029CCBF59|nr:RNA polymerase sigma factor [Actinocorallia sp. A-T 12471]MDX6742326.1 RNA polymerase sigma factor [Actinocorallia sp. A-T 12471]